MPSSIPPGLLDLLLASGGSGDSGSGAAEDSDSGGGQILRLLRCARAAYTCHAPLHAHLSWPLHVDVRVVRRLVRLLRLLKLLKLSEYITVVEERFDMNLSFLRIGQMVASMLYITHILGCFWFYIGSIDGLDPDVVTWIST